MRTLLRLSMLLLIPCLVLCLTGCEKDEIVPDRMEETGDIAWAFTYSGIEVVEDAEFGEYLSFKSLDDVRKLTVVLTENFSEEKITRWETGLNFTSLRSTTEEDELAQEPGVAAILNPEGYLMVKGVLYKDAPDEMGYYRLDGNSKTLVVPNQEKSNCYTTRGDSDQDTGGYCQGNRDAYKLSSKFYTSYSYWSGRRTAYLKVWHYAICNGTVRASGDASVTYSYRYSSDDGSGSSPGSNQTRNNDSYHRFRLFSATEMCIEDLDVDVRGSWANASATTHHSD